MVLYPEAQQKAQEEIDAVLGTGRLPEFDDEASLPYVSALCQEVQRWHPVAPIGKLMLSSSIKKKTNRDALFRYPPST